MFRGRYGNSKEGKQGIRPAEDTRNALVGRRYLPESIENPGDQGCHNFAGISSP